MLLHSRIRRILLSQYPGLDRIGQGFTVGVADDELPRNHRLCFVQRDSPRLPHSDQGTVPCQGFALGHFAGVYRYSVVLCRHKQPSSFCGQPLLCGADRSSAGLIAPLQ